MGKSENRMGLQKEFLFLEPLKLGKTKKKDPR